MRSTIRLHLLLLSVLVLQASAANAAAQSLSLKQALALTLRQSPEMRPALEAERGYIAAARQANPPLSFNPHVELLAGMRRSPTQTRPEWGVAASQTVPLAGLASPRKAQAAASVGLAHAQVAAMRLDLLKEVAAAWVALRSAEQLETLAAQRTARAQVIAQIAAGKVDVGVGSAAEKSLAQAQLAGAQSRARRATLEREQVAQRLRLLLDLKAGATIATSGEFPASTAPLPGRSTATSTSQHPQVLIAEQNAAVLEAKSDLLLAEGGARLEIGASVVHEGTGDWVLLGRVGLPLPWVNTQAYPSAEQRAPAAAFRFEARHWLERLAKQRAHLNQRLAEQQQLVSHIEQSELNSVREALTILRAQFEAGKIALPLVLPAEEALANAEESLLEAQGRILETRIELAWADGYLANWAGH